MEILLRQVRIIDPSSPFHQQLKDIFIQNGFISEIGAINRKADSEIALDGLCVSPGWMDVFAHFCDPGLEYRETLLSGAEAAAAGGFTDVLVVPNTSPVLHNKSAIEYIVQRSMPLPVQVHPIAAVTKNTEGKELAEMYDMHQSGAKAFGDGIHSIQSPGLLLKALQYIRAVDGVIIQLPDDRSISGHGLMHEGVVSTRLGLPGKPAIGEELMVARDIELAKYTGSRIHITGITTSGSVERIRKAKQEGIRITCSVSPYHLYFTDEDLQTYDTNLKLNPPLRTRADVDVLKQALTDGTIDCIASHHLPHHIDHKVVEFEYAQFGMTGLETVYSIVREAMPALSEERLVEILCRTPRSIFGLDLPAIEQDARASLTLFLPEQEWNPAKLRSRSGNSAFIGKTLKAKVAGIINKDQLFLNQ